MFGETLNDTFPAVYSIYIIWQLNTINDKITGKKWGKQDKCITIFKKTSLSKVWCYYKKWSNGSSFQIWLASDTASEIWKKKGYVT